LFLHQFGSSEAYSRTPTYDDHISSMKIHNTHLVVDQLYHYMQYKTIVKGVAPQCQPLSWTGH